MDFAKVPFRSAFFQLHQLVSSEKHIQLSTVWPECRTERLALLRVPGIDESRVCVTAVRNHERDGLPAMHYPLDADFARSACHCTELVVGKGAYLNPAFPRSYEQLTLHTSSNDALTFIRSHVRKLFLLADAEEPRPVLAEALSRLDGRLRVLYLDGMPADSDRIGDELLAFSLRHNLHKRLLRPRLMISLNNEIVFYHFFAQNKAKLEDVRVCFNVSIMIETPTMPADTFLKWAESLAPTFVKSSYCCQNDLTLFVPGKVITMIRAERRVETPSAKLRNSERFDKVKILRDHLVFNKMYAHEFEHATPDRTFRRPISDARTTTFHCERLVVEASDALSATAVRSYRNLRLRVLTQQTLEFVHKDLISFSVQSAEQIHCDELLNRLSHRIQFVGVRWQNLSDPHVFGESLLSFSRQRRLHRMSSRPRITVEFGRIQEDGGFDTLDHDCGSKIINFLAKNIKAFIHPDQRFVVQITSFLPLETQCVNKLRRKLASRFKAVPPMIPHHRHDLCFLAPQLALAFMKRI